MLPLLLAFGAGAALSHLLKSDTKKTSVSTGLDEFGDYGAPSSSYAVSPYRTQAAQSYGRPQLTAAPEGGPTPAGRATVASYAASPYRGQAAQYPAFQRLKNPIPKKIHTSLESSVGWVEQIVQQVIADPCAFKGEVPLILSLATMASSYDPEGARKLRNLAHYIGQVCPNARDPIVSNFFRRQY